MPNTFYAKQAEYAAWQARPLLLRASVLIMQLSTGPLVLLWPGIIACAIQVVRRRDIAMAATLVWCVTYALLYALRLPPYQHGRYVMPVMPMLFLLGLLGLIQLKGALVSGQYHGIAQAVWQWSIALLSAGFLLLGARAYGQDVGLIESEMVRTARWVEGNIPAGAVIAAHDIGALGYFDQHPLIDLAGLVSPEVLPIIRDEARLAEFLDERGVRYLIAFPDVYPDLARISLPVYSTEGSFAPAMRAKNMTVYCWRCR
jgi:hypothetical protein